MLDELLLLVLLDDVELELDELLVELWLELLVLLELEALDVLDPP